MANLIDFTQVTPKVIQDLSSIAFANAVLGGELDNQIDIVQGVQSGDRLPTLYPFSMIGKSSRGCSPTEDSGSAKLVEKEWLLKKWDFRVSQCEEEIEKSLYRLGLKNGIDIFDLTGTPFMNLLLDLLERAIKETYMRFTWFGDTQAKNASSSGSITDGVDAEYFKVVDGAWKQISEMISAAKGIYKTEIAANAKESKAEQVAAEGMKPIEIVSSLINNAPIELKDTPIADRRVFVSQAFFDKLVMAMYAENLATEAQFAQRENGIQTLKLFGQTIEAMPYWTLEINRSFDNGTKFDNPYRALYTTKQNIKMGLPEGEDMGSYKAWYEQKDHKMYIDGAGRLDIKVVRPELISVAI